MRKMKSTIKTKSIIASLLVSVLFLANSCEEYDFGDININPGQTVTPLPPALLTKAIWAVTSYEVSTRQSLYVQYLSETQYPETSLYSIGPGGWGEYTGTGSTTGGLQNLNTIINYNSDAETKEAAADHGSNANQIAVARILKAYIFSKVSDRFGDIPYSESLNGNTFPVYDSQESIYKDILKELTEAENGFDAGAMPSGDILLNGNKADWKRLANSLRMVLSLRLSKRYPGAGDYAATQFNAALNDADGYIDSNDDNIEFPHTTLTTYANGWFRLFQTRADFSPSNVLVDDLIARNDPRLPVYINKTEGGDYKGLPYGFTRPQLITWTATNQYSLMGDDLRQLQSPSYFLTSSYISLTRAEAAQLGWTSEVAATLYTKGIQDSWEQYDVFDAAAFATYMADPQNAYAGNMLEQIGDQKWLSLFPNGSEMYSDWRRTGYPVLTPTPNATNESGEIPIRDPYPSNESDLNSENYEAAVARLASGDNDQSPVWWDN
tara:strand:+ start:339022 stop:340503 length:1482 start_codon:yes stop_codon:yes gene_type:complete